VDVIAAMCNAPLSLSRCHFATHESAAVFTDAGMTILSFTLVLDSVVHDEIVITGASEATVSIMRFALPRKSPPDEFFDTVNEMIDEVPTTALSGTETNRVVASVVVVLSGQVHEFVSKGSSL
jgi:hypothetical protein